MFWRPCTIMKIFTIMIFQFLAGFICSPGIRKSRKLCQKQGQKQFCLLQQEIQNRHWISNHQPLDYKTDSLDVAPHFNEIPQQHLLMISPLRQNSKKWERTEFQTANPWNTTSTLAVAPTSMLFISPLFWLLLSLHNWERTPKNKGEKQEGQKQQLSQVLLAATRETEQALSFEPPTSGLQDRYSRRCTTLKSRSQQPLMTPLTQLLLSLQNWERTLKKEGEKQEGQKQQLSQVLPSASTERYA